MRNPDDIPRFGRGSDGTRSRSRTWLIAIVVAVVVVILSGQAIARFYTSYLWFDSVASTDIWSKLLLTKVALGAGFSLLFFGILYVNLYLADRRTDLILSGGVNVYPAEVEAVLMAHPAVADAAVIGELVHAVVEPRPDPAPDLVADLSTHCARHLAEFKRPRRIELRDSLPRSEAGKLLRRVLRDEYRPRRPEGAP